MGRIDLEEKYIGYVNRFHRWRDIYDLSVLPSLLYFNILNLFNKAGWPEKITIDNIRLIQLAETSSLKNAIQIRDEVIDAGFIACRKLKGGKAYTYRLVEDPLSNVKCARLRRKNRTGYRNIAGYSKWRKSVYERDNYTCQMCGCEGKKLNAHHIKPWAEFPEFRFSVDNGVTLCEACHKSIHRKMV